MEQIQKFNSILKSFKINATCVDFKSSNNYFFYDLKLGESTRVKSIEKVQDEIALYLQAPSRPSIKVLHKEGIVRLEFIDPSNGAVDLLQAFNQYPKPFYQIPCLLGFKVNGEPLWMDLSQNPHTIVAGTTGSGKTTLLHNIIANVLYYNSGNLHLVDPKNIEFSIYHQRYDSIKVYYDYNSVTNLLSKCIEIMNYRFSMLKRGFSIDDFNSEIIIIDEFADLIMQDTTMEFYNSLCMLAQKCRAAKIYLIISTQRPSVNIINGMIKANFPARISCRVSSKTDSKIVLDSIGAESLVGKGDALIKDNFRNLERFQTAYISPKEYII